MLILMLLWVLLFALLSWKLNDEFRWKRYRLTGGDKSFERALASQHIYGMMMRYAIFFVIMYSFLQGVSCLFLAILFP
jgi:hypothetical protein